MPSRAGHRPLSIAIIGGGVGGLCAALSLRRSGHTVTIYERSDFVGEVGASISCAANGMRWLTEWGADIPSGDPVNLLQLINRDWKTGEPVSVVSLADYEKTWGQPYLMFHRQYMHRMLKTAAEQKEGPGVPVKVVLNHKCSAVDTETGTITFNDDPNTTVIHDVVVGSDGIGSAVRNIIGIYPEKRPADSSCLHANVDTATAVKLGLIDYSKNNAIEYWGGHHSLNKIVLSPCNGGSLLSYYCFFPREKGDFAAQAWDAESSLDDLLNPYPDLDPQGVFKHLEIGQEIRPWRLWVHEPYSHWQKGVVAIMGDAAHPMMPDQSQGACMAIEDSAALGLVFSPQFFDGDVTSALQLYQKIRHHRASRVQAASARARENIHERIGFSDNTDNPLYTVKDEEQKLTIEEMNAYNMRDHVAKEIEARKAGQDEWANIGEGTYQKAWRGKATGSTTAAVVA
jgi:salicylate hydroxylase